MSVSTCASRMFRERARLPARVHIASAPRDAATNRIERTEVIGNVRFAQTQTWTMRLGSLSLPVHSPMEVVTNLTSYCGCASSHSLTCSSR